MFRFLRRPFPMTDEEVINQALKAVNEYAKQHKGSDFDIDESVKCAVKLLDFKSITAEVVMEISSIPLERPGGFFKRHPVKVDVSPETLREMLLRKVWGKGVELLNSQEAKAEPLVAERTLSELMKRAEEKPEIIIDDEDDDENMLIP